MTTKRELGYLVGGVGLGIYGPKLAPKLKVVKAVKFFAEVFRARRRLHKVLIEEYYRIEEAIAVEEAFLKMINPQIKYTSSPVSFSVRESGGDRIIHLQIGDPGTD